jgi:hypothetical protein
MITIEKPGPHWIVRLGDQVFSVVSRVQAMHNLDEGRLCIRSYPTGIEATLRRGDFRILERVTVDFEAQKAAA